MHIWRILRFVGLLIFFLGAFMVVPVLVSLLSKDGSTASLLASMAITCGTGLLLFVIGNRDRERHFNHRDGVAIVTIGWIVAGLFGAIPFLLSDSISGFTDAYFESVSGFTTTGASILQDIERLPRSALLWRSIISWLGGMGIIVLSIAILPFLGVGGMQLYKAEIPSPVVDKLKPRISDTARALWKVYILLTVIQIFLLLIGGMSFFDAVNHAFCTMPTCGFSPRNASIAYYHSPYIDAIISVFMLIAGMNFSLHYKCLRGDGKIYFRDPEARWFLGIVGLFILLITLNIYGPICDSLGNAFREAAFQVSSIITTTGFTTSDFDQWPPFSKSILLLCMFLGGMAGSTAGGIKTLRIMLLAKHAYQEMFKLIHPHAVTTVKLGGKSVPPDVMNSIWGFTFICLTVFIASALTMAALGLDLVSAFSSVAACLFNVGPALGLAGPTQNYFSMPLLGKWVLIFCMLVGRLEFYTVVIFLIPEYWRK